MTHQPWFTLRKANIVAKKALMLFAASVFAMLPVGDVVAIEPTEATWTDGAFPVAEIVEEGAERIPECFPTTFQYRAYENSDDAFGHMKDVDVCATQNGLGFFGSPTFGQPVTSPHSYNYIQPNTDIAFRTILGSRQSVGVLPVPNQSTFILARGDSSTSQGGRHLRFYDNFSEAGNFGRVDRQQEMVFSFDTPLKAPLQDSDGRDLQMMDGYAFSNDGRWMVAEIRGLGIVRIDTQTRDKLLFSTTTFTYGQGWRPFMSLAVSDDGNTVIRGGASTIGPLPVVAYDLSECERVPFAAGEDNLLPGCKRRNLTENLRDTVPDFHTMSFRSFDASGKSVRAVINTRDSDDNRTSYAASYSVAGYQPQQLSYLALGDSFSSGTGTFEYFDETLPGTVPENECHLSPDSHPFLTARALGITDSFQSVACSGAKADPHYLHTPQYLGDVFEASHGGWLPGVLRQQDYITLAGDTSAISISMIGNDVGFSTKFRACAFNVTSCFGYREQRESLAYEIVSKFDTLVSLYTNIKQRAGNGTNVYVLGYPQIFSDGFECGVNAVLDHEERTMIRAATSYLNAVIEAATQRAGVVYIDVEDAFAGHRICDSGDKAVHGLTSGEIPSMIAPQSFHPNELGHELLSQNLLAQSDSLTKTMPEPVANANPPYEGTQVYNQLMGGMPHGGIKFRILQHAKLATSSILSRQSGVTINYSAPNLKPNSTYELWFNSDPVFAGTLKTDENGRLAGDTPIPGDLEPGHHMLHVYGLDIAGEEIMLYQEIFLEHDDTEPPVVTGVLAREPDHGNWYNDDVLINWSAVDPEPSSGTPTQPEPTLADQEGVHTYTSEESCDPAGNCATGDITIKLDKTAPDLGTPEWSANPKAETEATTLTVSATDNVSGVAKAEYYIGDDDPGEGNAVDMELADGELIAHFADDLPAGVHRINIRAQDVAGNWSELTTDYLVVYNLFGAHMVGNGHMQVALGDTNPFGNDSDQTDRASFGFNVHYDKSGDIHPQSSFQFSYTTGDKCSVPSRATNCHNLRLESDALSWLALHGENNSIGTFEGVGTFQIDEEQQEVLFRVTSTDERRLEFSEQGAFSLRIYSKEDSPGVDQPMYKLSSKVDRGNVRIRIN